MEEKQVLVRIEDLCKYFRLSSKEELKAVDIFGGDFIESDGFCAVFVVERSPAQ